MSTETAILRVSQCRLMRGRSNGQFDHRAILSSAERHALQTLLVSDNYKFRIFGYRRNLVTVNKFVSVTMLGFFIL